MQVSVEKPSQLERKLTIQVPAVELQQEEKARLHKISKQARLKGFRPGKTPMTVVKKHFGQQVRQEAIQSVVEKTLTAALKQEKLNPVQLPTVKQLKSEQNQDLQYSVFFEVFPEVFLKPYAEITLEKPTYEIKPEDVEDALDKLQAHLVHFEKTDQAATETDKVQIDYTSTINGKPYEYSSAENVPIDLGSKRFLPGFEEKLIGAKAGDCLEFALTYPQDWGLKQVAGKEAVFKATVKSVLKKKKPALDSAFAEKIGAKGDSKEAILEKVQQGLARQLDHLVQYRLQESLMKEMMAQNNITLPKTLIEAEKKAVQEEWEPRLGKMGKVSGEIEKKLEAEATRRVEVSLLLKKVIEQEKIQLNQERVQRKFIELMQMNNYKVDDLNDTLKQQLIAQAQQNTLIDQAVELLLEKVTLTEKEVSVKAIMEGRWSDSQTLDKVQEA